MFAHLNSDVCVLDLWIIFEFEKKYIYASRHMEATLVHGGK